MKYQQFNGDLMYKIIHFLLIFLFVSAGSALAQFDILEKVKEKVEKKTEEKIDETIDKGIDEATREREESEEEEISSGTEEEKLETDVRENGGAKKEETDLKAFSKYDFIPGENVVFFEDFSQDNIGDFPARWNTNSSGEIVTLNNYPGNWFAPGGEGVFIPEVLTQFPDNFTLEFDLIYNVLDFNPPDFQIDFISSLEGERMDALVPGNGGVAFKIGAYGYGIFNWKDQEYGEIDNQKESEYLIKNNKKKVRISLWLQKQRARLWIEENKIFDIPRAVPPGLSLDKIRFGKWDSDENYFYITNLRVAVGAPDTRSKLITDGKLVTHGIYFDSGSDIIKPESYGTIKDIAGVLKENSGIKVKIVGHTDSDGNDDSNLDLSKRRAASVKKTLTTEFQIDESQLETDGKGEGEPIGPNDSPEGKANNRRVEFIKM
jgi:OmpA-OmpF porin, OOP family